VTELEILAVCLPSDHVIAFAAVFVPQGSLLSIAGREAVCIGRGETSRQHSPVLSVRSDCTTEVFNTVQAYAVDGQLNINYAITPAWG